MKIVLGEAKEEYDTDVQMAVTRQLILRVNTEIKPEEAYVVSEITYSQRTGYSYTLINTQTKERRTTNLIRPLSKRFGVGSVSYTHLPIALWSSVGASGTISSADPARSCILWYLRLLAICNLDYFCRHFL